ncbi:MAG: hypothetical protein ACQKBV_12500 [Puniceicoccales bacterium]
MATPLLIIGAGGQALESLWLARLMNESGSARWECVGLADDNVPVGTLAGGVAVLGKPVEIARRLGRGTAFHVAIGDNRIRLRIAGEMTALGLEPARLISPRAEIAPDATVGVGCYISHFVSIGPQARIGAHAIVNVSAVVGHQAVLGDGAQLCPGAVVNGDCRLGEGVFLGAGAVLPPCLKVGDWARVSANTFAAAEVEPGVTVATMPGRPVFKRKRREP